LLPSQIERLSVFESSRHCPWQVPVCPERIFRLASSWILASAYTPAASQSPPPSKVPGLKTSGSTKRSFFRTRFLSPIITGWLYRSSVCISCPNRSHKDRCVRFFALPGDMTFSLRQVLPLSFGAPAQNIRKSLSRLQRRRGSVFLDVPHDTVLVSTHFWIRIVLVKPEWPGRLVSRELFVKPAKEKALRLVLATRTAEPRAQRIAVGILMVSMSTVSAASTA